MYLNRNPVGILYPVSPGLRKAISMLSLFTLMITPVTKTTKPIMNCGSTGSFYMWEYYKVIDHINQSAFIGLFSFRNEGFGC